jgi:recombination protein RecA
MLNLASDLRSRVEAALENRIPRALTPPQRSSPELMPTGIASVDTLTGGVPLGCLTEICGPASSGRTSVLMALISQCTRRGEICALVDAGDAFDPQSAASAGVDLERLLWVRCGKESGHRVIGSSGEVLSSCHSERSEESLSVPMSSRRDQNSQYSCSARTSLQSVGIPPAKTGRFGMTKKPRFTSPDHPMTRWPDLEQALKATDLLLQAGGFGLIVLDLADVPVAAARRIPLTTWFRFRRTVENTSTALVVVEDQPHAKSCASLVMELSSKQTSWSEAAEPNTIVGAHSGASPSPLGEVAFCVTSQGIAIPFDRSTSSFEMPQRWNTPRLLDSVHVHLQVTRSRINRADKFPVQSDHVIPSAGARGIPTVAKTLQVQ